MADNLTLNSGTGGATLSTDEVTRATVTQHVQYVKLMNGTDGAIDVIPGDATNGLTVNLGTNNDVTVTGTVTVDGSGVTQPVSAASLPLPSGASTAANQSTANTALAAIQTAVETIDNPVATIGTTPLQRVAIFDAADTQITTFGGGTQYTEGDTDATITGTAVMFESNTGTNALSAVSNSNPLPIADAGGSLTVDNAALSVTGGGAEATALRVTLANDSTGVLSVDDNGSTISIDDGAGSITVDGTVAVSSLPASTNTLEVVGDAAHDAAVAGNPVRIAGRAVSADYTSVATGDTADLITTLGGKLVTHPYAIPENYVSGATSDMTATTATSVIAAAGAGLRNYITHILVQCSHATVGTWVNITDGSGGSTLYTVYAAAAGGGASITLPCPIKTTANTALYCANVTTGSNTRVSASGYKAP